MGPRTTVAVLVKETMDYVSFFLLRLQYRMMMTWVCCIRPEGR